VDTIVSPGSAELKMGSPRAYIPSDTGSNLLDRRLHASMGRHPTTGWGVCPEHKRLRSQATVALAKRNPQRSGTRSDAGSMKRAQA